MMRGRIAAVAVVATLAIAGTAVAAGGGPGGVFGGDHKQELAQDLANQLEGVNANEVEQALDSVAEEKVTERRAAMAEGIATELDGVNADQVADALAKHEEQMRAAFESGERPDPESNGLAATLAAELGVSEDEVTTALESAREAGIEEHKAAALERLDEAVADGDITDEQADQIRERIESGAGGPGHGGPGHGGPGHGGPGFGPGGPGFGPDGAPEAGSEGASAPAPGLPGAAA